MSHIEVYSEKDLHGFVTQSFTPKAPINPPDGNHLALIPTIGYDRSSVASGWRGPKEGGKIQEVRLQTFPQMESDAAKRSSCYGTCREISAFVAQKLRTQIREKEKLSAQEARDRVRIRACCDPDSGEFHYAVIAKVQDRWYLLDLGYAQPILKPIPIDGLPVFESRYSKESGAPLFRGEIMYKTQNIKSNADGSPKNFSLKIAPEQGNQKILNFQPLSLKLDQQIVYKFLLAMKGLYSTRVKLGYQPETDPVQFTKTSYSDPAEEAKILRQFRAAESIPIRFNKS